MVVEPLAREDPLMLVQSVYIVLCLVGIVACFMLQAYRYRAAKGCRWWLYSGLALGLAWEALETWKFGAPGFPATRWLTTPAISATLMWAAIEDWRSRSLL